MPNPKLSMDEILHRSLVDRPVHFSEAKREIMEMFLHTPANHETLKKISSFSVGVSMDPWYLEEDRKELRKLLESFAQECRDKLGITDD